MHKAFNKKKKISKLEVEKFLETLKIRESLDEASEMVNKNGVYVHLFVEKDKGVRSFQIIDLNEFSFQKNGDANWHTVGAVFLDWQYFIVKPNPKGSAQFNKNNKKSIQKGIDKLVKIHFFFLKK